MPVFDSFCGVKGGLGYLGRPSLMIRRAFRRSSIVWSVVVWWGQLAEIAMVAMVGGHMQLTSYTMNS